MISLQYIKNKRHKYGSKFFELCESKGIVLKVSIYSGEGYEDPNNLGQTGAIVLHLEGYLDKGYSVYTDNYYNSIPLTEFLTSHSTYITGTLRKNRKGLPKNVINKKLKKGEHEWGRKGATVVCRWKDKRDIYVISNKQQVQMVNAINRRGEEKVKPNIVVDCNNHISGVDHCDCDGDAPPPLCVHPCFRL